MAASERSSVEALLAGAQGVAPRIASKFPFLVRSLLVAMGACLLSTASLASGASQVGSATGLPVPRYVSLRSDHVNMRQGPSKEHGTLWIYRKAGLPVEITAEFETWRRVRDSDGTEGWVLHSLLSGRRTAVIKPWQKEGLVDIRRSPDVESAVAARLEPRVIASVRKCDLDWCRIEGPNFDGYIPQKDLWGVYPGELVK